MGMWREFMIVALMLYSAQESALAQDSNFKYPVAEIEKVFRTLAFEVLELAELQRVGTGHGQEVFQAKRAVLKINGDRSMKVKWKTAPVSGEAFNNQPRYEIAAYELQKVFLQPGEYVVPPTVLNSLPVQQYRALDRKVVPTFDDVRSVVFMLQYWLDNVTPDNIFDEERFEADSLYAHHLANMNILSYLIDHQDSNLGNFLISTDPANPRVFAVDNGVSFASEPSARGTKWRTLRVRRLPQETISRLRGVSAQDLQEKLGVVAQFTITRGLLFLSDPATNLDPKIGLRKSDTVLQFGLTTNEIKDVYDRLQSLLEEVDTGRIQTF